MNIKKMEIIMSMILTLGTIISIVLVMLGGGVYLWQHGSEPAQFAIIENYTLSSMFTTFNAFSLIELGLMVLVATQTIRVLMLTIYYAYERDYKFTVISGFVLLILIASVLLQK